MTAVYYNLDSSYFHTLPRLKLDLRQKSRLELGRFVSSGLHTTACPLYLRSSDSLESREQPLFSATVADFHSYQS
jgi:hypothetical protein